MIDLHKEFPTGGGSGGVRIRSIVDVAVWCVPWMVTSHPRYVFLESLVKVKQRPGHDHVIVD